MSVQAIVTDIEGTTSSIRFVHEVLFPYARAHLPAFVRDHATDPEVQQWLQIAAREGHVPQDDLVAITDLLVCWIDADRKSTPLKALQGMIWKHGYASGAYRAHVYPEVPARLRAWHEAGIALYVYSSGSVPAQKLLFEHTEAGDLTPLLSGYFDTRTGAKRDTESYRRITRAIGLPAMEILFLSDVVEELDAAREAGMHTTLLCRPPAAFPEACTHPCAADFDHIIAV